MKKHQIVLICGLCLITIIGIIARATDTLEYYTMSAGSNEPTLKTGSLVFTSNLITPERLDFVAFSTITPESGKQIWVHRICGMPGDTLEIKDGDLFVNGHAMDESLNLKKLYVLPFSQIDIDQFNQLELMPVTADSVMVPLETIRQEALIRNARRRIHQDEENPEIAAKFGQNWTATRFGPYIVPNGKYFVMGDNRYLSLDSRYIGPINKEDVVGTVIQ